MATRRVSLRRVLPALAVLLWTPALSYGQAQPTGIMYTRDASPAISATATTPTQPPMEYHGGLTIAQLDELCFLVGQPG